MSPRSRAQTLTTHEPLQAWVEKMVALCRPDAVHWVDGSQDEYDALCQQLVDAGTFVKLNEATWPGCYYARSDAGDVARVEDRTYIRSLARDNAGPTNNREDPHVMRKRL